MLIAQPLERGLALMQGRVYLHCNVGSLIGIRIE